MCSSCLNTLAGRKGVCLTGCTVQSKFSGSKQRMCKVMDALCCTCYNLCPFENGLLEILCPITSNPYFSQVLGNLYCWEIFSCCGVMVLYRYLLNYHMNVFNVKCILTSPIHVTQQCDLIREVFRYHCI